MKRSQQNSKQFVRQAVSELNSTLIDLVLELKEAGELLRLESLSWKPGWLSFLQYLAHTYPEIGNHERFAAEVEQGLPGNTRVSRTA